MNSIISSTLALALTGSVASAQDVLPQQNNDWFTAAPAELAKKAALTPNTNKAKNVIILISDGNGVGTNYATRLFEGQQNGLVLRLSGLKHALQKGDEFEIEFDFGHIEMHAQAEDANATRHSHAGHAH